MMRCQLVAEEGLHPRSASMPLTCDRSAAANLPKVIHPLEGTMCHATVQPGGYKEMSSIFTDQPMSTAVHQKVGIASVWLKN
jgi:hypothetical protein